MDRHERAELIRRLRRDARRIADRFGLRYRKIVAEDPRVKSRYGACFEDGVIKIRLNHARTDEPLKYSSLIDTLCHELAHLRHFNHGPEFKDFFFALLGWARRQGIYQPGPPRAARDKKQQLADLRLSIAAYKGPTRRNGVPVFVKEEPKDLPLPWEQTGAPAPATASAPVPGRAASNAPVPGRAASKPPPKTPSKTPLKPRQLSLF